MKIYYFVEGDIWFAFYLNAYSGREIFVPKSLSVKGNTRKNQDKFRKLMFINICSDNNIFIKIVLPFPFSGKVNRQTGTKQIRFFPQWVISMSDEIFL